MRTTPEITSARHYARIMGILDGDYQVVRYEHGFKSVKMFNLSRDRAQEIIIQGFWPGAVVETM